jgi:hypothetical protein
MPISSGDLYTVCKFIEGPLEKLEAAAWCGNEQRYSSA